MKYAFHSGGFHNLPLSEVIAKLKEYGYDAIEINGEHLPWIENEKDIHIRPEMSEEEVKKIKIILDQKNLKVSAVSAHIELIDRDPEKRKYVIWHTKQLISFAKLLGTDVVHGLSGNKPEDMSDEEAWDILVGILDEILEYAEEQNIRYAFEPIVGMFINSGEKLKKLREKVSKGTLYVNFDPSHLILVNDDIPQLVRDFGGDIIHVHFKDGKGKTENFEFPPIGQGVIDFEKFVAALKEIGYDNYLSIEYEAHVFGNGSYSDNIDQVARKSIDIMKKYVC